MELEQPAELLERALVVVHPEVDEDVREPRVSLLRADDEDRRRLLAATVAARRLRCVEAVEQALGERASRRSASNVSASASTVSAETRMLPCAA